MRSFYMRIFKNIICIYVLVLCCFAYATMIHAIPDHVYVQEGQKLELDKKIPVTLAMSTKPQSVMAQIGERTFQAMKQERAVETCSQLKQGEYTLTCYLFGDGSRFAGMHKLFAQELPLPLQEIDFTKVIDLRSGKNKAAEGTVTPDAASSGTRPKAATAVGFLSVIGAAVHPIDARPKDMLVADSKKNDLHTAYVILAGAVLVSVLLILGSGVRQLLAYREHRNLTKRINDLSYVQETYDDYARVQAEEQVYEKLDLATITKNEQLYPLIAQLENELPTTIHVKNIQTDGSLVTLNMEADRKVTVGQMLLNFADVTLLENLSIPSMSEESDEDSGTVKWTYTLNAYYTGAFLGEDRHLIKEAVPSADTDADTDTDGVEGEEQTNE